jgi:hypothetical protein
MLKYLISISILLGFSIYIFGQNDFENFTLDPAKLEHDELLQWVNDFNNRNLNNRVDYKNDKTHRLDSTLYIQFYPQGPDAGSRDYSRSYYFYKEDRDIICIYRKENFFADWEASNIIIDHYDDENLLTSSSYNSWDGDLINFNDNDPLVLRSFFYDENMRLSEEHAQNQFELQNKILADVNYYHYYDDGRLKSTEFFDWSVQLDSLIFVKETKYFYDANDNLVLTMRYDNDRDRGYFATDSIVRIVNNEGLLEKTITYEKARTTDDWLLRTESSYSFDNEGRPDRVESRRYNHANNSWRAGDTTFSKYHTYGSLSDITTVQTDSSSFGSTGGLLFEDIRSKTEYFHDENVLNNQVKRSRSYIPRNNENHMILEKKEFINAEPGGSQYGTSILTETSSTEYFYSEIKPSATVDIIEDATVYRIAPNPASDNIEIISSEYSGEVHFSLTDISGRRVIDQKTYPNEGINIPYLNSGIYIYTVSDGKYTSTGKVVID